MADNRKLAQGLMMMTPSARADLAQREGDIQRGKTVELLRRAGQEMYDNPIVNTAIGFTPVLGDVQAAGETMAALNRGAPWQETAGYAAGMLPFVPMIGKTVWHGSPHTFDKFDLSKIGTGEGAQAYGHGLYLAESPETASMYKELLSKNKAAEDSNYQKIVKKGEALSERLSNVHGVSDLETLGELIENKNFQDIPEKYINAFEQYKNRKDIAYKNALENTGALYKVDLPDEQIAKMLDWDKPLSEQNEYVQQAIRSQMPDKSWEVMKNRRGQDYYEHYWNAGIGGSGQNRWASQSLEDLGIPGIQYLDQASRGAGEGTRNYVVFSDEIPQILERNGQPVAQALRNYGLEHRPMTIEGGASQLHELTPSFGEDVYGKQAMQFFGSGDPREKKALEIMKSVRGNPDAPVTIYRGVPEGVNQINQGDWVTIVPEVAADYGNVISQQVPASHITSWPDSLMEFGYYPPKAK